MHKKTLHLTLKENWFKMILSGEKKEEYRERKDYWLKRLTNFFESSGSFYEFKSFDTITFKHGYSANAPTIVIELLGITEGCGKEEWGGTNNVIILQLGKILETKNLK